MYQLIQLSDLENDFINPHDAARNINWVVVSAVQNASSAPAVALAPSVCRAALAAR